MTKKIPTIDPSEQKVNYLMKAIYFVENKIMALESSLIELQNKNSQSSHDLPNAVRVIGALEQPKNHKLTISESQLIDIYNEVPQLLTAYAIRVALTPESYQQEKENIIFLETNNNGNYWIIKTEQQIHWLVPRINLKFNIHKLKSVRRLFRSIGTNVTVNQDFFLVHPAKVTEIKSLKKWRLEELGELDFSATSPLESKKLENIQYQEQLLKVVEQLVQENSELRQKVDTLSYRIEGFAKIIKDFEKVKDKLNFWK